MKENVVLKIECRNPWGIDYEISPEASMDELSTALASIVQLIAADDLLMEAWDKALIKVEGTEYEPSE